METHHLTLYNADTAAPFGIGLEGTLEEMADVTVNPAHASAIRASAVVSGVPGTGEEVAPSGALSDSQTTSPTDSAEAQGAGVVIEEAAEKLTPSEESAEKLPTSNEAAEKLTTPAVVSLAAPAQAEPPQPGLGLNPKPLNPNPTPAPRSTPAEAAVGGVGRGAVDEKLPEDYIDTCGFTATGTFLGARPGFAFMLDSLGQSYYPDAASAPTEASKAKYRKKKVRRLMKAAEAAMKALDTEAVTAASPKERHVSFADDGLDGQSLVTAPDSMSGSLAPVAAAAGSSFAAASASSGARNVAPSRTEGKGAVSEEAAEELTSSVEADGKLAAPEEAAEKLSIPEVSSTAGHEQSATAPKARVPLKHYWGQALQYLDRRVPVVAGKKLTLLAKRDGNRVRFSLRVRPGVMHALVV